MALRDLLILIAVLALHGFAFGQSSDHCVGDGLDMDPRGYHYVGGRDVVYLFEEDGNLVSKDGKEWTTINEVRPRKAAAPSPEQTGHTSSTKPSGPNVVLIMTDDQGYGELSCHRHPFLKTPNLDQSHAEGIRLTNYHASPLCGPTRAALMTGLHCQNVAFQSNPPPSDLISWETPAVANVFADNGYRTGIFVKWHLGDPYPHRTIDRGFTAAVVHGGFDETVGVMDDMVEAVFTVTLKTGDCDILAQFIADDGKEYGAWFLFVECKELTGKEHQIKRLRKCAKDGKEHAAYF